MSPIFKYMMDTEEEIKMLVLNFPNSIDTVKEFVTESEFRYAGLLRKETIKGDVEQYVY